MSPLSIINIPESPLYIRLLSMVAWIPFVAIIKNADEGKIIIKLDLGRIIEMIIIGVTVAIVTTWLLGPTKKQIDKIYKDIYESPEIEEKK